MQLWGSCHPIGWIILVVLLFGTTDASVSKVTPPMLLQVSLATFPM